MNIQYRLYLIENKMVKQEPWKNENKQYPVLL